MVVQVYDSQALCILNTVHQNCLPIGGIESADTSMNIVESFDGDMSPCELWVEITGHVCGGDKMVG